MKELSIEQKAKRYDEVVNEIKNLRDILLKEGVINENGIICDNFNRIFPELNETDDEKIRKIISEILLIDSDEIREILDANNVLMQDINAWLEKQGEHEYPLKLSNMLDVSKLTEQITKLAKDYELNLPNRSYDIYAFAKDILVWIEKQYKNVQGKSALEIVKEEKVDKANKVEPKFKVGDWITDGNITLQIEAIKNNCYLYSGDCYLYSIKTADKVYHLWTINDAKDGDIIYAESRDNTLDFICIFSKLENEKSWVYCSVTSDSDYLGNDLKHWDFDEYGGFINLYNYDFYPSTKAQRDILFQKMKEAGYEWVLKPKVEIKRRNDDDKI